MRMVLVVVLALILSMMVADRVFAAGCDQGTYDLIYETVIQQVLDQPLTQESIETKNNTIELLRKLCNNQLSSYETGRKK